MSAGTAAKREVISTRVEEAERVEYRRQRRQEGRRSGAARLYALISIVGKRRREEAAA